jgi:flagellar basal-body rod modification protein FlgD
MANSIDPNLMLSSLSKPKLAKGQQTLGKDDFLKILMTQLQNQDPMNPMQDKEFISQMASFSSLEQMTNMTSTLQKFIDMQAGNSILQYSELIGKQVTWSATVDDVLVDKTGIVKAVQTQGNKVVLEMEDATQILADNVKKVSQSDGDKK